MKKIRLEFMDNLKVALTCLVILHHTVIAYGGEGLFVISARTQGSLVFNLIMTGILAINQSYFMGLFFLISSYFTYQSLINNSKDKLIKKKIKRLLLPALGYFFLISPLIYVIIDFFYKKVPLSHISFKFGIGPLWFILALFIFDLVYILLASDMEDKKELKDKKEMKDKAGKEDRRQDEVRLLKAKPQIGDLVKALCLVTFVTWLVRIVFPVGVALPILGFQPSHFPQYIFAYYLGIQINKNKWLSFLSDKKYEKVLLLMMPLVMCLGLVIALIIGTGNDLTLAFGGANMFSFMYSLFDQLMFVVMSLGLISLFYKGLNKSNKVTAFLSKRAFAAYICHSFVIVISVMIVTYLQVTHVLSFLLVCLLAIPFSFVFGGFFLKHS